MAAEQPDREDPLGRPNFHGYEENPFARVIVVASIADDR
jgi:hypothetical protein